MIVINSVHLPTDGIARHRANDPRSPSAKESSPAISLFDDTSRDPKAFGRADCNIVGSSSCLEQSLDDI